MQRYIISFFILVISLCITTSCQDKDLSQDTDKISFSLDTVCFDTLFSETSSYTKTFLVRNINKKTITFTSIKLGSGANSNFRFNVDGYIPNDDNALYNIEILGKDSIYVFVETLVPNGESVDLLISDSLIFTYENKVSQVQLQVVGKNAVVLRNYSITDGEVFTSSKPYLIMGDLRVPNGKTLKVEAGAELYFTTASNFIVDGNIEFKGTKDNPIYIRGHRFDYLNNSDKTPYEYLPSQWGSIYLQNPNGNHLLEYTNIKGSSKGILLLGLARSNPKLIVRNSVLHTFGGYGIYSQNGHLVIENTEISNCGYSCLSVIGGELSMVHSTIANYYRFGERQMPACYISNYLKQGFTSNYYPITSAVIENSIIFGINATEIVLDKDTVNGTLYNVVLSNNLLKSKEIKRTEFYNNFWAYSQNNMGYDTVFVNTVIDKEKGYYNFQLDTLSHARSRGNRIVSLSYPLDLLGKSRLADDAPDLGAYEY